MHDGYQYTSVYEVHGEWDEATELPAVPVMPQELDAGGGGGGRS